MAQIDKLLTRFIAKPVPTDLTWANLERVMEYFGYRRHGKSGGSREKFYHPEKETILSLHKPHNPPQLKTYQVKEVIKRLKHDGFLK